jgi:uncharacterized protein DUF2628
MSFIASASREHPEPVPATLQDAAPASPDDVLAPVQEAAHAAPALDDLALFIGHNAAAFVTSPEAGRARTRGGICWPGFLLPTPWLLYRKMYGWAAITVLLPVFLSLVHVPSGVLRWIGLGSAILGAFGKRLYLAAARRAIAAIRAGAPDEISARETIARAGGASHAGAAVGVLLIAAFFAFAFLRT